MATKTQTVTNMNPTSDMTLDDIIRDLEARRDKARDMIIKAMIMMGLSNGWLELKASSAYDSGLNYGPDVRLVFTEEATEAIAGASCDLIDAYNKAQADLCQAVALRDALDTGED